MKTYHKNKDTAKSTTEKLRVTKKLSSEKWITLFLLLIKTGTWQKTTSPTSKGDRFIQFVPAAEKQRTRRCFGLQFEVSALNADASLSSIFCQGKSHGGRLSKYFKPKPVHEMLLPNPPPAPLPFTWRLAEIIGYIFVKRGRLHEDDRIWKITSTFIMSFCSQERHFFPSVFHWCAEYLLGPERCICQYFLNANIGHYTQHWIIFIN